MGYARYVGRVGALAVALGVGAAVATTPGVAWAEETSVADTSSEPTDNTTTDTQAAAHPAPTSDSESADAQSPAESPKTAEASPSQHTQVVGEGVTISSSGGAIHADDEVAEVEETATPTTEPTAAVPSAQPTSTPSPAGTAAAQPEAGSGRPADTHVNTAARRNGALHTDPVSESASSDDEVAMTRTLSAVDDNSASAMSLMSTDAEPVVPQAFSTAITPAAPAASPVSTVTSLLAAVFSPLLSTGPVAPVEPPMLWVLMAAARRQVGSLFGDPAAPQVATMAAAAAPTTNLPPVFNAPQIGTPNTETGVVSGTVTAVDPNGRSVRYSVTGQPLGGTVTINATTGAFTYTPTAGTRLAAGFTPSADTDAFTVRASDGYKTSTLSVPVTVSPTYLSAGNNAPITVGNNPSGLALNADGSRIFVTNQGANTVSVINTTTKQVTNVTVGGSPSAVAVNKAGTRAYVTNSADGTVSVINTATNTVVATVRVGTNPSAVAVTPDGTRIYVTNAADGTVSKINASTNRIVGTNAVGANPTAVVFSADGKRAYVTNTGGDSVSMITLSTNSVKTIAVGDAPIGAAVSPDGNRVYVAHSDGSIKVLEGTNKNVTATIATTGNLPVSVALTPDGRMLLVVNRNDTITAISTATNAVLGSTVTDFAAEPGAQRIVMSPDGKSVYVLDTADKVLRTLSITSNVAPSAANDTASVAEGATTTINVLANDTDANGNINPGSVVLGAAAHGTVSVNASGVVTYANDGGEAITDTFTYTVKDTVGATSNTATVTVTITPVNDAPVADVDTASVSEGGSTTISVLSGDADADGTLDPTTVVVTQHPANGGVTVNPDGTITYQHNGSETTTDTFAYTVEDNSGAVSNAATVTVTVDPVNDAPVALDAGPINLAEDTVLSGPADSLAAASADADGDVLTVTSVSNAQNGTVVLENGIITFTPTADFNGIASFDYTVSDGLLTDTGTLRYNVTAVNDPPVVTATSAGQPTGADAVVAGSVTADDNDNDTLTYTGTATKGSVIVTSSGSFTYTPDPQARHAAAAVNATAADKQDTVTITITDGHGGTTTADITVTVLGANQNPTVATTSVGQPTGTNAAVSGSVTVNDLDNDTVTYSGSGPTAKGNVTVNADGTFTYIPRPDARHQASASTASAADRQDVFTITITDGHGGTTTADVTVTVLGANQNPTVATTSVGQPTGTNAAVSGSVTVNDFDNDTVTYSGSGPTAKGNVTVNADGTFTYIPRPDARHQAAAVTATPADKQDTVTITVTDGHGGSTTANVTVTVLGANQNPTVTASSAGQPSGSNAAVSGSVTVNDLDNDSLTYTGTGATAKGNVTVNSGGTFTYIPRPDARHQAAAVTATPADKQDTVTITVTDGHGGTTTANVTVDVLGKNDAPVVTATFAGNPTGQNGTVFGSVASTDPDGDTRFYSATATKGTVTITSSGSFTYTPDPAARHAAAAVNATAADKQDTVTVTIIDAYGGSTATTVTVAVSPRNSNPTGNPTVGNFAEGVLRGTTGITDADGDTLNYTVTTPPTKGTIEFDSAAGTFTYTPSPAARAAATATTGIDTDTFTFTVSDGYGGQISRTVTVEVMEAAVVADVRTPDFAGTPVLTPDGTRAIAVSARSNSGSGTFTHVVHVIDTTTGNVLSTREFEPIPGSQTAGFDVRYSPDGKYAVITPGTIHTTLGTYATHVALIDLTTGAVVGESTTLNGTRELQSSVFRATALFAPDGRTVWASAASTASDGTITSQLALLTADGTVTSTTDNYVIGMEFVPNSNRALVNTWTPNPFGYQVTVVDTAALTPVGNTINLDGIRWGSAAFNTAGTRAVVLSTVSGASEITKITVIDTATGAVVGTPVAVTGSREGVLQVGPGGSRVAVVVNEGTTFTNINSKVVIVDTNTGVVIGGGPTALTGRAQDGPIFSQNGSRIIQTTTTTTQTGNSTIRVYVLDAATGAVVGSPTVISGFTNDGLQVTPDGTRAFLTYGVSGGTRVQMFSTATGLPTGTAATMPGGASSSVVFTPDGSRAIQVTRVGAVNPNGTYSDTTYVGVINTATGALIGSVTQMTIPEHGSVGYGAGVRLSPDGSRALVTSSWVHATGTPGGYANRLALIDTVTGTQVGSTIVYSGNYPDAAVFSANSDGLMLHGLTYDPATGNYFDRLMLVETDTGAVRTFNASNGSSEAISADGTRALTVTGVTVDGVTKRRITVIDTAGNTVTFDATSAAELTARFTDSGVLAAGSSFDFQNYRVRIYNFEL